MIGYEEALRLVTRNAEKISARTIRVAIEDALNYYTAEDIRAPFDLPRFTNSQMDGYAVKSSDTRSASLNNPVRLRVAGEVKTGLLFSQVLKKGEAFAISTGSKLPTGADAVIMKEDCAFIKGFITITKPVSKGENIRYQGEEFKKGDIVLERGRLITPQVVGLLAICGFKDITVVKRPKISFISSGTELVEPGRKANEYQIYNSNYYSISALLRKYGFETNYFGITKDEYTVTKRLIQRALQSSNILLISGGVSVGNVDFVREILKELRVKQIFWRINIKPGKPIFFGKSEQKLIFGLPGNPVSSFVNSFLFVIPALRKVIGASNPNHPIFVASLDCDIDKSEKRREFLRGFFYYGENGLRVIPVQNQQSHMMGGLADSNCLIITDEGERKYKKGEKVKILLL